MLQTREACEVLPKSEQRPGVSLPQDNGRNTGRELRLATGLKAALKAVLRRKKSNKMAGHRVQLHGEGGSWSPAPFHHRRPRHEITCSARVAPLDARDQGGDGSESDAIRLKRLPNPLRITFPLEAHYYNHISFVQLELHLLFYLAFNPHNPLATSFKMPVVAGPPAAGPSTFDKSMSTPTPVYYNAVHLG